MAQNPYPCDHPVPIEQEPRHHLVIANDFVRAFAVEIAPHDRTLCHQHEHEYLMYVTGNAEIVSAPRDGDSTTHTYHDGYCELSPPGLVHVVENLEDTKFRNLLVELLPQLGELLRGDEPRIAAGNGVVEAIFEEERILVWSIEMEPGAQAEVYGPAIVATLYNERLLPKGPGDITVKPHNISDMAWIPFARASLLQSSPNTSERAIVFQLGWIEEQLLAVRKRAGEPLKSLRTHAEDSE